MSCCFRPGRIICPSCHDPVWTSPKFAARCRPTGSSLCNCSGKNTADARETRIILAGRKFGCSRRTLKIRLLPGRLGSDTQLQLLTCFVINDCVAADAGSLGFALSADERKSVQHIVLTHAHLDHIASLPIFIDEEFSRLTSPVIVHGIPEVISVV